MVTLRILNQLIHKQFGCLKCKFNTKRICVKMIIINFNVLSISLYKVSIVVY